MENTAKKHKRLSLTLSNRLHQKRHSASPQSRGRSSAAPDVAKEAPGSPTLQLMSGAAANIESTPPNKKSLSLDDSVDFSPRLDISMSPSCLFSQTLVTESPDVGWRWNRNNNSKGTDKVNTTTDSGFDSAESECRLSERRKQAAGNESKYAARRNQLDNEQWRAQQIRAREQLKERCERLHRQLEQVTVQPPPESKTVPVASAVGMRTHSATTPATPVASKAPAPKAHNAALDDFLNDSDTDCFLLEATQQVESELVPTKPAITPTSHRKEQRPSFYMKFLEDETETDDWFASLDEAVLLATNAKRPRNSLQRYKSMPATATTSEATGCVVTMSNAIAGTGAGSSGTTSTSTASNLTDTPRMKRHASSHALSPATSHVRGKLFGSRK